MNIRFLFIFTLFLSTFFACKKDKDRSTPNILTAKVWKKGIVDKNPSTNPPGKILYQAVPDCEKDDSYRFKSNGKLVINRKANQCEPNEQPTETQTYTCDITVKVLTINGVQFSLAEASKEQIKYYAPLPGGSGSSYIVYLLQ
ncbi:hypothetical protein [Compostibacter hankyongensis]|uniref:hypothetical protein n=1 Tax=Compostibacter hankyongensis TaxID=1007089 RepID=UPI0031E60AEF